jgi:hypothetical protein
MLAAGNRSGRPFPISALDDERTLTGSFFAHTLPVDFNLTAILALMFEIVAHGGSPR